jgi:phage terminase small subunit
MPKQTNPPPPPPPPAHLSERSQDLWRRLVPGRCRSLGRRTMLGEALAQLDRLDQLRAALASEGLIVGSETGKMPHLNPLLKAEKDARTLFTRMWDVLGLQWSGEIDGRHRPDDPPEE